MYSTDDTIVAIATPPGRGGIGVVRLSGPHAAEIGADPRALAERGVTSRAVVLEDFLAVGAVARLVDLGQELGDQLVDLSVRRAGERFEELRRAL